MLTFWNGCPERWGLFWRYAALLGAFLCTLLCCRGLGWWSSRGPSQLLWLWGSPRAFCTLWTYENHFLVARALYKLFRPGDVSSATRGRQQPAVSCAPALQRKKQRWLLSPPPGTAQTFPSSNKEFAGIYEDFLLSSPAGFISWNFFLPSSPGPIHVPAECSHPWGCATSSPELAPLGAVTPGCCCLPVWCLST